MGAEMASEDDDGRVQIGPYEVYSFPFCWNGLREYTHRRSIQNILKKAQPSEMKCAKKTLRN
jgi:hypothetical protein